MAGCWPWSFSCKVMDLDSISVHKHTKKTWPKLSCHLDLTLSITHICWLKLKFIFYVSFTKDGHSWRYIRMLHYQTRHKQWQQGWQKEHSLQNSCTRAIKTPWLAIVMLNLTTAQNWVDSLAKIWNGWWSKLLATLMMNIGTRWALDNLCYICTTQPTSGRHGGRMVSALVSRSSSSGLNPALHCILGQDTLLSRVPLSTQVYKWILANLMLGIIPCDDYHPIQGGVETFLVASGYRNLTKHWPDGPQGRYAHFKVAGYSFQHFSRLRVWWVIKVIPW